MRRLWTLSFLSTSGGRAPSGKDAGISATTTVEVKVIPSIYEFITLRAEAEMFEGLPLSRCRALPLWMEHYPQA